VGADVALGVGVGSGTRVGMGVGFDVHVTGGVLKERANGSCTTCLVGGEVLPGLETVGIGWQAKREIITIKGRKTVVIRCTVVGFCSLLKTRSPLGLSRQRICPA